MEIGEIVDLSALKSMPRYGVEWPPIWRAACEALFINGYSPRKIASELKGVDGPSEGTISNWAGDEDWYRKRDEYQQEIVRKALAKTETEAVDAVQRHIKYLKVAEARLMQDISNRATTAKTLEGAVSALVSAIKAERQVLGINGEQPDVHLEDNRVQTIVTSVTGIPPEKREDYFAAMRAKFEAEQALTQIVEGKASEKTRSALYEQSQAKAD